SSFSGANVNFTPDISQVSYTFTSSSGTVGAGSGGTSNNEGPLHAGSYKFNASFAGDANYNSTVSGDEPLTINKANLLVIVSNQHKCEGETFTFNNTEF